MAKRGLVVVESPTKVKTIAKYLEGKYVVKAWNGSSLGSCDVEIAEK